MQKMKSLWMTVALIGLSSATALWAQRPISRPSPPRAVPRSVPSTAERQHQARRSRLAREANARSGSILNSAPGKPGVVPVAPRRERAVPLSKSALARATRDFSLFELGSRRARTERIVGELRGKPGEDSVKIVCLRHRGRGGSVEVVLRHSSTEPERPRLVLARREASGRIQWWSAAGWRRRVRVEKVLRGSPLMGSAFKYGDFLPVQPPSSELMLLDSKTFDGALGHKYQWSLGGSNCGSLMLDAVSRRPRRLEFAQSGKPALGRRIDRLDVRSIGINRRAFLWRAVDRHRKRSSTFVIKEFRINIPIDSKFFTKEGFREAPF